MLQYRLEDHPGSDLVHTPSRVTLCPLKGEVLAVADALYKARYFVLGCDNLIIAVDHKPLIKLLVTDHLRTLPTPD